MLAGVGAGGAGVTLMETRVAGVTVNVVDPDTPPMLAVMVAVPGAAAVAVPPAAPVATMEAMLGLDEVQLAVEVRS